MQEPQESDALIAIVDDDPSVRRGLQRLIRSVGWKAETFASAQEFLARPRIEPPSCLVLDLQLPGLSGLDLQQRMAEARVGHPHRLPYRPWQYPSLRAGNESGRDRVSDQAVR